MVDLYDNEVIGVVGGMGPLASAEFMRTVYRLGVAHGEQYAPCLILHSDPTMPDRSEALLDHRFDAVYDRLVKILRGLEGMGASRFVIVCMTIHCLVPLLPRELRERVVSLIDAAMNALVADNLRRLLICTTGARALRVFESHERWHEVRDRVALPDRHDQRQIHEMIYCIKRNRGTGPIHDRLRELRMKYDVDGFIAGCTELHLLHPGAAAGSIVNGRQDTGGLWLDPLDMVALQLNGIPT